jgi:hypothetical protein
MSVRFQTLLSSAYRQKLSIGVLEFQSAYSTVMFCFAILLFDMCHIIALTEPDLRLNSTDKMSGGFKGCAPVSLAHGLDRQTEIESPLSVHN